MAGDMQDQQIFTAAHNGSPHLLQLLGGRCNNHLFDRDRALRLQLGWRLIRLLLLLHRFRPQRLFRLCVLRAGVSRARLLVSGLLPGFEF